MTAIRELLVEVRSRRFIPIVLVGILIGVTQLFFHISLAALIFADRLVPFIADGIGVILFGAIAMSVSIALFASFAGGMPVIQDTPGAIMAIVAAAIMSQMPASSSPEEGYFTVVAAISTTTLATGLMYLLVGRFKLSSLARFVPYPVVGGFLAGSGWILVEGSIGVMSGLPHWLSEVPQLVQPAVLLRWVPGALFAIALVVAERRSSHPLLMPGFLAGAFALFYLAMLATGTSRGEAQAMGLLLDSFPQEALWSPLRPETLALVDWSVVLSQAGKLASIMVLSVISLMLNCSGLELALRKDVDFDRELMAAGIGNIVGGLGGSSVGYQSVSTTTLAQRLGGAARLSTIVMAAVLAGAMLFGAGVLSYLPKPLLGGLLFYLGLSFLIEWIYDAARGLPRTDYALILIILGIVATVGFLQAVAVGMVMAVILFAVTYSRVDFVKDTLSGVSFRSRMDRAAEHNRVLDQNGGQIHVLRLQGFLFFGTAQNLLNRVRRRLHDSTQPRLRFLLLDFHRVSDLDISAVMSFTRMYQLAETNQLHLVLTECTAAIQKRLQRGGLVEGPDSLCRFFPTLDRGMEWCEGRLLSGDAAVTAGAPASLRTQLEKVFSETQIERFMRYLERMEFEQGQALITQGQPPDAMFFVDSGRVSAQLEGGAGKSLRLRSMGSGTVVGEIGMYLKQARTASIVADVPSVVYRLSETALTEMEKLDPDLAAAMHHWMVRLLSHRLTDNNRTLEALLS
jgi:SulP family sulfate permease